MAREITIERVTSPLIIASVILFLVHLLLAGHVDMITHASLGVIASFFGFCIPVYLGLISGLSGGHPRPLLEALMPVASTMAFLAAAAYSILYSVLPRLILLFGLVVALVFVVIQARDHGSSISRKAALSLPFLSGLIVTVGIEGFVNIVSAMVFYTVLTMPLSIALVMLYSSRISDKAVGAYSVIVLAGALLYSVYETPILLSIPLLAGSIILASGRIWSLLHKPVIGDAALSHILLLFLTPLVSFMLFVGDIVGAAHTVILGGALPMVLTQAPNIAPILVASTWRRRRSRLYPSLLLLLASLSAWRVIPLLSQVLAISAIAWAFYALNPSPRRIFLILVYETEKGYMEAYLDAVNSGRPRA